MYGIEDQDGGITCHKIGKDDLFAILTATEKEGHLVKTVVTTEKGAKKPPVPNEYLSPIEGNGGTNEPPTWEIYLYSPRVDGGGKKFDALVGECVGLQGTTASISPPH